MTTSSLSVPSCHHIMQMTIWSYHQIITSWYHHDQIITPSLHHTFVPSSYHHAIIWSYCHFIIPARRNPGGTQETARRHPGCTQETQKAPETPRGSQGTREVVEVQCANTIIFYCQKWRNWPFRVDRSGPTITKSAACAQKLRRGARNWSTRGNPSPISGPPEPLQPRAF